MPNLINDILAWIGVAWQALLFVLVLKEVGAILKGIKGNNGKWQIDEVSKIVIYVLLYIMIEAEKVRDHEWMIFPVWLYILLIFAVLMMAKLEAVIDKFIEFIKAWKGNQNGNKENITKDSDESQVG